VGLIAATATGASPYTGRRRRAGRRHGLLPAPRRVDHHRRMQQSAALLRVPAAGVPRSEPDHAATLPAPRARVLLSVLSFDPCVSQLYKVLCFAGWLSRRATIEVSDCKRQMPGTAVSRGR